MHLERYLGYRWSKAAFSAAERSVDGRRIREFNANELVAFAMAFDLPLGWFLIPPPGAKAIRTAEARRRDHDEEGTSIDGDKGWTVDYILQMSRMNVPPRTGEAGEPTLEGKNLQNWLAGFSHQLRVFAERLDRQALTEISGATALPEIPEMPTPPHPLERT